MPAVQSIQPQLLGDGKFTNTAIAGGLAAGTTLLAPLSIVVDAVGTADNPQSRIRGGSLVWQWATTINDDAQIPPVAAPALPGPRYRLIRPWLLSVPLEALRAPPSVWNNPTPDSVAQLDDGFDPWQKNGLCSSPLSMTFKAGLALYLPSGTLPGPGTSWRGGLWIWWVPTPVQVTGSSGA